MKKIIVASVLILLLGIGLFVGKEKPEHRLAICAIFYNEAPQLKEWIEFHHKAIKVDHFYLYNNNSTDDFQEVLAPYINEGLVEVIEWKSTKDHGVFGIDDTTFVPYQIGAYRDCLQNRALKKAEWVAMIDIDEFIVPGNGVEGFYSVLEKAKKKKIGSLKIYWKVFGTSKVKSLNPGELLTEKLIRCAPDDYEWNTQVKSIHQPKLAQYECTVHKLDKIKKGYKIRSIPLEECRIHHYWTGTEEQCKKHRNFDPHHQEEFMNTLNTIEDLSIYPYIKKTAIP